MPDTKPNFWGMRAVEAMKPQHEHHLATANKLADAFREAVDAMEDLRLEAYRLAYAFYSGVRWEELTDKERLAFLIWQEGIEP